MTVDFALNKLVMNCSNENQNKDIFGFRVKLKIIKLGMNETFIPTHFLSKVKPQPYAWYDIPSHLGLQAGSETSEAN